MKKIAFLMRYDFKEVNGGDVLQVNNYIPYFEEAGYSCSLLNELNIDNVALFNIFIIVNVDRPIETIRYFDFIKKNAPGKKIYLIPIHHPIQAIDKFERRERSFIYSLICSLFPNFYSREKIKNIVRIFKNYSFASAAISHLFRDYNQELKKIIQGVDGVIYISDGERLAVESDFLCQQPNYCIAYNAVETNPSSFEKNKMTRDIDVIVVGRIEPRKNQLKVAKLIAKMGLKTIFIGQANNQNQNYNDKFLSIIDASENIEYLGALPHSEVLKYFRRSKVLLNASFFEVNPLVDLEGALLGTGVVTTENSYTKESLPNVLEVDPWSDESISLALKNCLENPEMTIIDKTINSSWRNAADSILELMAK